MVHSPVAYPRRSPENKAFWDAASEGRFLLRYCERCEAAHWYPRPICPFCLENKTVWRASPGHAEIYSYTHIRKADAQRTFGYVTLDDGPSILTRISGFESESSVHIGAAVTAGFEANDAGLLELIFKPREPK